MAIYFLVRLDNAATVVVKEWRQRRGGGLCRLLGLKRARARGRWWSGVGGWSLSPIPILQSRWVSRCRVITGSRIPSPPPPTGVVRRTIGQGFSRCADSSRSPTEHSAEHSPYIHCRANRERSFSTWKYV